VSINHGEDEVVRYSIFNIEVLNMVPIRILIKNVQGMENKEKPLRQRDV